MSEENKPEEKKPEAKKPEAPKKLSLLESTIDSYLGCKQDPVKSLGGVGYFDKLRKEMYLAGIERAKKEIDPEEEYGQLNQVFRQIKQEMGYFVGEDKYRGMFDSMDREDQINQYTMLGTKLITDTINPNSGHQRRRR